MQAKDRKRTKSGNKSVQKSNGRVKQEVFTCAFCNKTFKRERTLDSHACEQRRRHRARHDKEVQLAFNIFQKVFAYSQPLAAKKTFEDFRKGGYYPAMFKFGSYCLDTKVINIPRYSDWLIKNEKPLDKWCTDKIYTEYLQNLVRVEPIEEALTRSIEYSIAWGTRTEMDPTDIFRYCPPNGIVSGIVAGKISPWFVYWSESGQQFLQNNAVLLETIWDIIDPDAWNKIFDKRPEDCTYASDLLDEGGW